MQSTPGGPDLSGEWVIRIIDESPQGVAPGVTHAITEKGLYLIRYRGGSFGERITVTDGEGIVGLLRHRDLSSTVQGELVGTLTDIIKENPEVFLMFYNRGGPINRKMHAFQLLTGVGPSKAQDMVKKRGRAGWSDFKSIDEAAGFDTAEALAIRLNEELGDPGMLPNILNMLIRAG
jgi:predicted nucleic acid-binding OB-fold protein